MKLCTFRRAEPGGPRVGMVRATGIVDLTALDGVAFADMLTVIRGGAVLLDRIRSLTSGRGEDIAIESVQLESPIPIPPRFRDFLCFEKHFRQARANRYLMGYGGGRLDPASIELPAVWYKIPIGYKGNTHNFVGSGADVHWPSYSHTIDYEFEIGVIVGSSGKDVSRSDALNHVFGFTIFNDFSARDAQYAEMSAGFGPSKGKDFDTGNALGPWIVTRDEIPDLEGLEMISRINGVEVARGNASDMRHKVADLVAYASTGESLVPGEVLGTGTVGNGCGMELGRFLKHHDIVDLEIPSIGVLSNRIVAPHVPLEPSLPLPPPQL